MKLSSMIALRMFVVVSIFCTGIRLNGMHLPVHLLPPPLTSPSDFYEDPSLTDAEQAAQRNLYDAFQSFDPQQIIACCDVANLTLPLQIDGSTPLMLAVRMANGNVIHTILTTVHHHNPAEVSGYIGTLNTAGETALSLAACFECQGIIAYLMQYPIAPITLIHAIIQAAFCLKIESIKTLLTHSRYPIINLYLLTARAIAATNIPASVSNQAALECFQTAYGSVLRTQINKIMLKHQQDANRRHKGNDDVSGAGTGAGSTSTRVAAR